MNSKRKQMKQNYEKTSIENKKGKGIKEGNKNKDEINGENDEDDESKKEKNSNSKESKEIEVGKTYFIDDVEYIQLDKDNLGKHMNEIKSLPKYFLKMQKIEVEIMHKEE